MLRFYWHTLNGLAIISSACAQGLPAQSVSMPRGSKLKTRNRKRDIDQIYEDSKPENTSKKVQEATVLDEDKPALGQYYCLPCDKYFCDGSTLEVHKKQKPHKRRLKALEEEPHSQVSVRLSIFAISRIY